MDQDPRRENYIKMYKAAAAQERQLKFNRMLKFGLYIVCCLMIAGGSTGLIAQTTARPTSFGPPTQEEVYAYANPRVAALTPTEDWQARRNAEDEILRIARGNRYSWPEFGIGNTTSTDALPEQDFENAIDNLGFPMAQILRTVRSAHSVYETGVDVANFSAEVIRLIENANSNIRSGIRGEFPSTVEVLRAPLQNHLMTIVIALVYAFLIHSLITSGRMGAAATQEQARSEQYADRAVAAEDRENVRLLIVAGQDAAALQAARQFLLTFVSLPPENQRLAIELGRSSGVLTPEFAEQLQQGLLRIANGSSSGLDLLADVASRQQMEFGGKGKKTKQSKRSKGQKGGAPSDVFLSEDAFFAFIQSYVPSRKQQQIMGLIEFVMASIEMELNIAYMIAKENRNYTLVRFLEKNIDRTSASTPENNSRTFSSVFSDLFTRKKSRQNSPTSTQEFPDNELGGSKQRQRQSRRQARRSRKGGKKSGRSRQSRRHKSARRA